MNGNQIAKLKKAYNALSQKLDKAYDKKKNKLPTIFISHNVPYNTRLDIVNDKKSYAYKKHLGSMVARKFCQKHC